MTSLVALRCKVSGIHRRRVRGDGGWLSLEFTGVLFLFLLTVMIVLQVAAATYTVAQANGAARAAARAATLNQSGQAAARAAVNPSLRPVATGARGSWTVTLTVPRVLPRMPQWTVQRSARMPETEPGSGMGG